MRRRSFKTVVVTFLLLALLIPTAVAANGTGSLPPDAGVSKVTIKINGKVQQIPKEMGRAYINKRTSRTMVPIRFVAENLGNKVEFIERQADHPKGAVLIKSDSKTIYFAIGSDQYEIYGDKTQRGVLDTPTVLAGNRTYVPLRFVSEALDYKVDWVNREVLIQKDPSKSPEGNKGRNSDGRNKGNDYGKGGSQEKPVKPQPRTVDSATDDSLAHYYTVAYANYRKSLGLSEVVRTSELDRIAQKRADEEIQQLATDGTFDHDSPSNLLDKNYLGENLIAWKYASDEPIREAFTSWRNSPGHDANMRNPRAKEYGYAYKVAVVGGKPCGIACFVYNQGRPEYRPYDPGKTVYPPKPNGGNNPPSYDPREWPTPTPPTPPSDSKSPLFDSSKNDDYYRYFSDKLTTSRRDNNLPPMGRNVALDQIAQLRADEELQQLLSGGWADHLSPSDSLRKNNLKECLLFWKDRAGSREVTMRSLPNMYNLWYSTSYDRAKLLDPNAREFGYAYKTVLSPGGDVAGMAVFVCR